MSSSDTSSTSAGFMLQREKTFAKRLCRIAPFLLLRDAVAYLDRMNVRIANGRRQPASANPERSMAALVRSHLSKGI